MNLLTVTIVDPSPNPGTKSGEVAYLQHVLNEISMELGRGRGTVTSGTVPGVDAAGHSNTSKASWTYTPVASKP
jgi:hypothetical protein